MLKKVLGGAFPTGVETLVNAMKGFQTAKQAVRPYIEMNYMKNASQVKDSGLQLREQLAEGKSAGPLVIEVLK